MNKYTVYFWVRKVVLSCKTYKQDATAENLINNHYTMFGDIVLYRKLMELSLSNLDNLTM